MTIKLIGEFLLLGTGTAVLSIIFEELGFSKVSLVLRVSLISSLTLFMLKKVVEVAQFMMKL